MTTTPEAPAAATQTRPATYTTPVAQLTETPEHFVLEAELPGVSKEHVEITVEQDELTLVGRRSAGPELGQALYRESRPRDFRRVFQLDRAVDAPKVTARVEHGVVTVTLPKAESQKPRRIAVAE